MAKKTFILPSTFTTDIPKFTQYNGRPYLSYSSYNSWNTDIYRGSWIAAKFLGIEDNGNIFSTFGSAVGDFLSGESTSELLSPSDIEILNTVPREEGAGYERMIVVDRGKYIIYGYIDKDVINDSGAIDVIDFKTGGAKKAKDYAAADYNQTRLYSYGLEAEGEEIGYVGVELLHRKGNKLLAGDKNNLRLEGKIESIPTPYNREETEKWLDKSFDNAADEISDLGNFMTKFFNYVSKV